MNRNDAAFILSKSKKLKSINLLGGECVRCGDKNISHLSFHHKVDKEFNITALFNTGRWSIIEPEIKKCILICNNCHREEHSSNGITYRQRNKNIILEAINKFECEKCGYNKCFGALDFHHIDEKNKKFSISNATLSICLNRVSDVAVHLLNELDKCILICANCHQDIHFDWDRYNKYQNIIVEKIKNYKETPIISENVIKQIIEMHKQGIGYKKITEQTKCSKATINKYINI